jgi:hypothetical protein
VTQAADCAAAAKKVPSTGANPPPGKVVAGFDGFVDNIISVVDSRKSQKEFTTVPTLAAFGARISAAAGESANVELVTNLQKIGGNGPIMCNAMCGYGVELVYIGPLGQGKPDAVFAPLVERTKEVFTLGPPANTDALEFKDGKLMMGKLQPLDAANYEAVKTAVGLEKLTDLYAKCDAIVSVNWTMVMNMTDIWQGCIKDVLPEVGRRSSKRKLFFVDIADPKKRTREDLRKCCDTLTEVNKFCDVVLSLNCSETRQCLEVFGETWDGGNEDFEAARLAAVKLRSKMGIHMLQVHMKGSAAGATAKESVGVPGYYTSDPVITTGGGDHFNSGFLSALMTGCSLADSLRIGGATSGNYVRGVSSRGEVTVGRSPKAEDTVGFLNKLPTIDVAPSSLM